MKYSYVFTTGLSLLILSWILTSCGGGGSTESLDTQLRSVIAANDLSGDPSQGRNLPSISDTIPQLGKKLFFRKSLSGDLHTACASCHHPAIGGGDRLSLPVGVGAINPDVVGLGRERSNALPNAGRHSQTVFNIGLFDSGLFFDSRIESLGKEAGMNGAGSGIRTPDMAFGIADVFAGDSLTRFRSSGRARAMMLVMMTLAANDKQPCLTTAFDFGHPRY